MKAPSLLLFSLSFTTLSFADNCDCIYCIGPSNDGVNAPVYPLTCNGDLEITASGLYWKAHQDGLEYAIETHSGTARDVRANLIDAHFKNPHFDWNWGFQLGLGYNTSCDGWNINGLWTRYHGKASSQDKADEDDNTSLLVIWSDLFSLPANPNIQPLAATNIRTEWQLRLNLFDVEFGRKFWNSQKVSLRPHVGIRIGYLNQDFDLFLQGSSWGNVSGEVQFENDYKGAGIRAGLDTDWHFGCGWFVYGNLAFAQLYGKFNIDQNERTRQIEAPFSKAPVLEAKNAFRAGNLQFDFAIGLAYSALLCDCDYALAVFLGYEQHLFLNQNQLWSIVPSKKEGFGLNNNYAKRKGDLSTQGWTLKLVFDF